MARYLLDPHHSLNIGLYAKNEGGEGNQKVVKEHLKKWTNQQPGALTSLVDQTIEVYTGSCYLDLKTCFAVFYLLKSPSFTNHFI